VTQLGFLLDHRKCIGCHACTVACKSENDVPVGDFRTYVKYQENGTFPDIKRHFAVLRCNHCTDAPCVEICPVVALDKMENGVVDIDRDVCIGCRACMQACPYDAIFLNDDRGSVEKCHYCNHRVDQGLEPACVVVCPEEAIVSGDLHDPTSRIAQMVEDMETEVRRPEQGTSPNVHYVGHEPSILKPGVAERPSTYIWSDRPNNKPEAWPETVATEEHVRTVLDAGHKVQWGFCVGLYLVTKGLAGGAGMLAPFAAALGLTGASLAYLPEVLALVFTTITTGLLVEDLTRPKLFLTLLTRGNPRSWLVKGAWILIAFSGVCSAIIGARILGLDGLADGLRWVEAPLGLAAALYTAMLFKQCEGRDLWQSDLLAPHLLAQALFLGAGGLLIANGSFGLALIAAIASVFHIALSVAEIARPHETSNATQAAGFLPVLKHLGLNPYRDGLILGAIAIPLFFVSPVAAFVVASFGLYLYEWAFIRAGQLPPLS